MECFDVSGLEKPLGLKVCQLCAVDFTLEKFLVPLVSGMLNQGWEVHSVCSDGPSVGRLRTQGFKIHVIPIARGFFRVSHLSSLTRLIKLFRREKFDLLHVHTPIAALLGRIAAKIAGISIVVYTAHGFYFHDDMPRWKYILYVSIEKLGGLLTDILFTQSAEDALTATRYRFLDSKNIHAIGNGVNLKRFSPTNWDCIADVRRAFKIPMDAFVVGFVGRLVEEKGVGDLIIAAEYATRQSPNIWFILIGERLPSDHAKGVEIELKKLSLQSSARVLMLGPRDDIPQLISAIDLFCLPSWREGMPRSLIEAMAMSKPVIATNIRGCREEVIHGETGILVPPRKPFELANAILQMSEKREECLMMGEKGRARALNFHDESLIIRKQIEIIREYFDEI